MHMYKFSASGNWKVGHLNTLPHSKKTTENGQILIFLFKGGKGLCSQDPGKEGF